MDDETPMETAKRRVVDARASLLVQEKLVARLGAAGQGTATARETVEVLRRALMVFEAEYEAMLMADEGRVSRDERD
jgi:hypothetical protein